MPIKCYLMPIKCLGWYNGLVVKTLSLTAGKPTDHVQDPRVVPWGDNN